MKRSAEACHLPIVRLQAPFFGIYFRPKYTSAFSSICTHGCFQDLGKQYFIFRYSVLDGIMSPSRGQPDLCPMHSVSNASNFRPSQP